MSQENVEIVKRGIDAFNRRDVDVLASLTTPDFAWFPALPGAVEGDGYRGLQGIETYFGEIRGTWDDLRVLGDEHRDLGVRVLVLGRAEGRGRGSGVRVDAPIGIIFDIRSGRISSARTFLDHGEALRATELPDEDSAAR
jgi:ketosteroid isomerase-like protein